MSNNDNLNTGMFATCSKVWNKTTQKYDASDSTDVFKCCSKQCIKPVKWCYDYCNKNIILDGDFSILGRCMETCDHEKNLCLDTCKLSSPYVGMGNNYYECSKKYDCIGIGNLPDKNCVKKYKDDIFECCRRTCIPTQDLDCQKHCEYIQSISLNPSIDGIPDKRPALSTLKSRIKKYPNNTWIYILGGLVFGIIVIIIWLLVYKRK